MIRARAEGPDEALPRLPEELCLYGDGRDLTAVATTANPNVVEDTRWLIVAGCSYRAARQRIVDWLGVGEISNETYSAMIATNVGRKPRRSAGQGAWS